MATIETGPSGRSGAGSNPRQNRERTWEGAYITRGPVGGTHGYLNTDPQMQALFIAWGSGTPRGIQLGPISNLDVAPTVAALLGIKMSAVKGHAIEPIVKRSDESSSTRSKD